MSGSNEFTRVQYRHDSVAPVVADQFASPRIDASAITLVNPGGVPFPVTDVTPSVYTSGGDARDGQIQAGAEALREIKCRNTTAATRYLMLFDAIALPANGTAPYWTSTTILAGNDSKEVWNPKLAFTTGIYWAISTTATTLTVGGATDANVSALWENI